MAASPMQNAMRKDEEIKKLKEELKKKDEEIKKLKELKKQYELQKKIVECDWCGGPKPCLCKPGMDDPH